MPDATAETDALILSNSVTFANQQCTAKDFHIQSPVYETRESSSHSHHGNQTNTSFLLLLLATLYRTAFLTLYRLNPKPCPATRATQRGFQRRRCPHIADHAPAMGDGLRSHEFPIENCRLAIRMGLAQCPHNQENRRRAAHHASKNRKAEIPQDRTFSKTACKT